jgi:hypothetical protein
MRSSAGMALESYVNFRVRLARAVGPQQPVNLAFLDPQVQPVQRHHPRAEPLDHPPRFHGEGTGSRARRPSTRPPGLCGLAGAGRFGRGGVDRTVDFRPLQCEGDDAHLVGDVDPWRPAAPGPDPPAEMPSITGSGPSWSSQAQRWVSQGCSRSQATAVPYRVWVVWSPPQLTAILEELPGDVDGPA